MESQKNVLVVYFSRTGNTRIAAEELARQLKCDIQEIRAIPTYPLGFMGYQRALLHATLKRKSNIRLDQSNLAKYDLIVVGSPVWGGAISSPVRAFLDTYRSQIKDIAFFLTQGGSFGRERVLMQVQELCGKSPSSFLALTEKDMHQGTFRMKVASFAEEIKLRTSEKAPPQRRPPESMASL